MLFVFHIGYQVTDWSPQQYNLLWSLSFCMEFTLCIGLGGMINNVLPIIIIIIIISSSSSSRSSSFIIALYIYKMI